MPPDGSKDKSSTYEEVLDEVAELFDKFLVTTTVIWGCDLNGSFARNSSRNDKLLIMFCAEQGLACSSSMPNLPTYYHFVANVISTIDMFIKDKNNPHHKSPVRIATREAANVGPHDPVIIDLDLSSPSGTRRGGTLPTSCQRVKPQQRHRNPECPHPILKFEI